jgi:hypothetical protein
MTAIPSWRFPLGSDFAPPPPVPFPLQPYGLVASAKLVLGIILALVAGWVTAILYSKTHFHSTGKGSRGTDFDTLVYSLALILALTLLASLRSAHVVWRVLFVGIVLLEVAFVWVLFYIAAPVDTSGFGSFWSQPLIQYLDAFPFFCTIALIGLFLKK